MQAKRSDELPSDPSDLHDLNRQITSMMRHSRESYAIIYTRQDVHIFRDSEYSDPPTDK